MKIRLWWALILCLGCSTASAKEKPLSSVADLRYGVALYHYYQNQHFLALSDLLVAEARGGIQGHGDNPEIMLGGFYMAYGLERTASEIFERLLDANRPQKTRDAAWLHLAKMRYLRGDWAESQEALSRVSEKPERAIARERDVLQVDLYIRQELIEEAIAIVDRVNARDERAPYFYFNVAGALARAGEYDRAVTYYNRLSEMRQRSEEFLSLYDKAMTAAGYSYLFNEQYDLASQQFRQVRLDGPFSHRALLGYGWAQAEAEDFKGALAPWQALSQRSLIDENTQESLVAIPYAYERMNLKSAALAQYRNAEASFESEITTLDLYMQDLRGDAMMQALNIDPSEDINWLDYAQDNKLAPQLSYLTELFSRNDFRGLIRELRDLLDLQRRLVEWQGRMRFYHDMLKEREVNRAAEMDYLKQKQVFDELNTLGNEQRDIFDYLRAIEADNDFTAILSGDDLTRLERIKRAEKNIALLEAAGEDVTAAKDKVRRHRGLLEWRSSQLFAERIWRADHNLNQLNEALTSATKGQERIQYIVDSGFDLIPYYERIAEAEVRLENQLQAVNNEISSSQQVLRDEVAKVLDQQRNRLRYYLAQSRLAIARLLDEADGEDY